jgi:hypothetical protein
MSFRFDTSKKDGSKEDVAHRPGAYIAILSEENSVHLGFSSTPQGCRTLARGFLGMRGDDPIDDADVVDGVSEVMNILAGKVKSKMTGRDGTLRLGLPMFIKNPVSVGQGTETVGSDVKIGPVECRLIVYRSKRAA